MSSSDADPNKPELGWDGFQWVTKFNTLAAPDPNLLSKTKKVRRVQLVNVPLYLGLAKEEIKDIVNRFMIDHCLEERGNKTPVHTLDMFPNNNSVILEFSTIEEAQRVQKLESINIIGVPCKVIRMTENPFGQDSSTVAIVQNAQVSSSERGQSLRRGNDCSKQVAERRSWSQRAESPENALRL